MDHHRHRWPAPLTAPPVRRAPLALFVLLALAVTALPVPVAAYDYAINCGGPEYVSTIEGRTFRIDLQYTPGSAGYVDGSAESVMNAGHRMGDTYDPHLYFTYRRDVSAYRFDVPLGDYLVRLYLGEVEVHGPGLHHLTFDLEGTVVEPEIDLAEHVGREYAVVLRFAVTVTDGTLDITPTSPEFTQLNAVSVESITPDGVPPASPTQINGYGSYHRNLVDWPKSPEIDVQGYRVHRAAAAGGPYSVIGRDPLSVSRYHDDDVTPGIPAYYRVSVVDVFGNESTLSDEIELTPILPSVSTLPVHKLTLGPAELLALQLDPVLDNYVTGDYEQGGDLRQGIAVRFRGNNTRKRSKKPYKVRFPYDELWNNRRKLNFHSMFYDKTLLRDNLGYKLFEDFGLMTPLNEIVHLELNNEYLGLYESLEQVDKYFLARLGLNPADNIYKAFDNLEVLATLEDYMERYTKETHEGSSYQDLIDLIELINLTPPASFPREISRALDVDEYLRYYAVIIAEANVDFTRSNFFLINDRDRDIWRVVPWDNDFCFGYTTTPEWPLDLGSFENPGWEASMLIGRLMETDQFRYAHAQNLLRLVDGPFSAANVDAHLQTTYDTIEFDGLRDWFKQIWENNVRFMEGPGTLSGWCDQRRAYIQTAAYDLMPEVPGLCMVNEILANNRTTITDEHGDYDPWMEIWNSAYTEIGVGGMFLSDDPGNPTLWALPDVRIPARGHLVVWLDGETGEGPLHAGFTPDPVNGGSLYLYDVLGNGNGELDSASYGPATADVAEGREPDGGTQTTLYVPTPGSRNVGGFDPPPVVSDVAHVPQMPAHEEPMTVTAQIVDESGVAAARVYYDLGNGFVWEEMLDDGAHGDGAAGDSIFGGTIAGATFQTVVEYYIWAEDDSVVAVTMPFDAPDVSYSIDVIGGHPPLVVNEFLADNTMTNPDPQGEFDDWMEIYNTGDHTVNLSGMSLSDDLLLPGRWELPDYQLAAGEFVLIWVDDDEDDGPLHANFKLNATGEQIIIFDVVQKDFALVDGYVFGPQTADVSEGRFPDGGGQWTFFTSPSPGYTNTGTGVHDAGNGSSLLRVFDLARPVPNPFNPYTTLRFSVPSRGDVRLGIYDVQGRLVTRLVDGMLEGGAHERVWDGRTAAGARAASGVYWVRLEAPGRTRSTRAVLIR